MLINDNEAGFSKKKKKKNLSDGSDLKNGPSSDYFLYFFCLLSRFNSRGHCRVHKKYGVSSEYL